MKPLSQRELVLLEEALGTLDPTRQALFDAATRNALTRAQRDELCLLIGAELCRSGLQADDEPNARGLELEDLLDKINDLKSDLRVIRVVAILMRLAESAGSPQDPPDVRRFVDDVLLGERDLLGAHKSGLVTSSEVVDALLDRFVVRTLGAPTRGSVDRRPEWRTAAKELYDALFGKFVAGP